MVIRSFQDKNTQVFFESGICPRRVGWVNAKKIAQRKLDMLHYAQQLQDLKSPPNNCLEALKGKLAGYYSIRINNQWRIIFKWNDEPFDVKIIDYH